MEKAQIWREKVLHELNTAEHARESGNEGQARVCARRAAGYAIGEYLSRHGYPIPGPSAIERMKYLQSLPETPTEIQEIIQHMMTRVNENFQLPVNVDLIQEAKDLIQTLLGENIY